MLKIAHTDDYNAMQKKCQWATGSVAGALISIMTSHFVALYRQQKFRQNKQPGWNLCQSSNKKVFSPGAVWLAYMS